MTIEKITKEQALPMYVKLKLAMNDLSYVKVPIDKVVNQCKDEYDRIDPYITYYGIPNVCLMNYVHVPEHIVERTPMIDLFVESKYRHQGLGTLMIDFAKTLSDVLYLNVLPNNVDAYNLYLKNNFVMENKQYGKLWQMKWTRQNQHDNR